MDRGRELFDNVVIKMGCRGANEYGVKAPKRKMDRRTGALTIIESVLGDTEKCRPAITGCDDKLEEALAHIRVPVREVPWGKRKDRGKVLYGTRTSMVMLMGWGGGGGDDVRVFTKEYEVGGQGGEGGEGGEGGVGVGGLVEEAGFLGDRQRIDEEGI